MKICFWGDIAGALKGNTPGGGQLQNALLAKALARGGHEVVILDYLIDEDFITDDGIKVFRIKGWNNGVKIIRTITHRLPQLYLSLKGQKADIYYCRIRDFRHIFAFWAARKVKAKFVLGIASDLDILNFRSRWKHSYLDKLGSLWFFFDLIMTEIFYPWLLRKSDYIFVQHEGQKEILLKKNINSIIFHNLIDKHEFPLISNIVRKEFIYVGSLDKRKGFDVFYEVITRSPMNKYVIIGQPRDKTGYNVYEKLKSFENVTLLGKLSHSEVLLKMMTSKALICTSPMEGFPNIFIESWACGLPVYSLFVDPGDVIKRESLGAVANGKIDKLMYDMSANNNMEEFPSRSKAYIENMHLLNDKKIKEIDYLFKGLKSN